MDAITDIKINNACECNGSEGAATALPEVFEVRLDDIHIWHLLPGSSQDHRFKFNENAAFIQMVFSLDSLSNFLAGDDILGAEEHTLFYIPDSCSSFDRLELDSQRELFGINISTSLFFRYLPENGPLLKKFTKHTRHTLPGKIAENRPLTTTMREVIHQILFCLRRDHSRCIYYQAKVMELLSLQMEQMESENEAGRGLKEEEIRRVYRVRDILEGSPEKSFSLLGLAHTVGTNDATLKKHFKMVFGVTVFTYLNAFRMERAKEMLLRREFKIASIANQFGYKHATHFSAAFKKHFGYPPTKING